MTCTTADVRACHRKLVYPTRRIAERIRRQQRMNGRLESYRCRCCGMWHLGTVNDVWWRLVRAIQRGFAGR